MRLSEFPFVEVQVACRHCPRRGKYRLARMAARYGAEIELTKLLGMLAADCALRDVRRPSNRFCGAHFADLVPDPDGPGKTKPPLRIVG